MQVQGEIKSINRDMDGNLIISIATTDTQEATESALKLQGKELSIELKKYSPKRSLNANAYFWKLCEQIAIVLHSDKDTIYLLQLSKYGQWIDIDVPEEAIELLKRTYRYVQECDGFVRCYIGSSHYTREEMSRLIDGTIEDAKDLGIETWSKEEIDHLLSLMNS